MRKFTAAIFMSLSLVLFCNSAFAQGSASIEVFSPQGTVTGVRQVSVRFSEQVVPFGEPRLIEPFDITCPEKGQGRWADGKNWVFDFSRDLPAGVRCEFRLKPELMTFSGKAVSGQKQFFFSTGGPAVRESYPRDGADIVEDQMFILMLDAEADEKTVLKNVSCSVEGINESIGVKVISGKEKEDLLATRYDPRFKEMPHLILQCRRVFPNSSVVRLVWGKGVSSVSGVQSTEDHAITFKVRPPFTATFGCDRENADANCIPILPLRLDFSSPVQWGTAKNIVLRGQGKTYSPAVISSHGDEAEDEEGGQEEKPAEDNDFVNSITFRGPFPEKAGFVIEVPKGLMDDAGRSLSNSDKFPLTVKTDPYPPLAKFTARFGIIELNGDAALPVTLRNLEPNVKTRLRKVEDKKGLSDKTKEAVLDKAVDLGESVKSYLPGSLNSKTTGVVEGMKGSLRKIRAVNEESIMSWLVKVAAAKRDSPLLKKDRDNREFQLPKPGGARAFEVVGIPLKEPGFYVVELESRILGTSLLGAPKPMYVQTAALVTNLSAHFLWGRESSLVWVTTLDKAEPVKDAEVSVRDCKGRQLWQGRTGEGGIAKITKKLPDEQELPSCEFHINYGETEHSLNKIERGLFVFAKSGGDMTFVHSGWDDGIEPYRYNLPEPDWRGPVLAHTIFDRTLLRAGETVHMKHVLRKHVTSGFSMADRNSVPKAVIIYHQGSNQKYEFSLKWDSKGTAETTWQVPQEAKLGTYKVALLKKPTEKKKAAASDGPEEGEYYNPDGWDSGSFRVEEFRVPLMKGTIQPRKGPLVRSSEIEVDVFVGYLSGGGAGELPVKLRSRIGPKTVSFSDYEDFIFANGQVKEETLKRSGYEMSDQQDRTTQPLLKSSELVLDKTGSARTRILDVSLSSVPQDALTELEFRDPGGEVQTVSSRIPLWPSNLLLGIKPDSWVSSKEAFRFHVIALDLSGRPLAGVDVKADLFGRKYYSHRKRLVGGFYSYEHVTETKRAGTLCEGKTDAGGLLICEVKSPVSGNVVVQASAADKDGNLSLAHRDIWIAGKGEWWFDVADNDRIDLLPEKKKYEPGETAKLQVRMPFREATALIAVEREGIIDTYVRHLSGREPVIEVPVKGSYSPNVFVSALVVRGRVSGVQPTALVDLGKPAYKLGIAGFRVGREAHELKVKVTPVQETYRTRQMAKVSITVTRPDGGLLPKGSEVAVAAVDEGLLELMPNKSWDLLEAMMGRRGYEVKTSTAQMQVVGKRHYGLKALPQGGGGGRQLTRELFDTLLYWKAKVPLDEKGQASVEIPLNDSLTGFRIVAVATGGTGLFGTGQAGIRTTQDLMILSGLPPLVREGDTFRAGFTVRNTSDRKMELLIAAKAKLDDERELQPVHESLLPGEAKEIDWQIKVPHGTTSIGYEVNVKEVGGEASDSLKVSQKVAEAVPVRTFQSTIERLSKGLAMEVERPSDAISGKGGIRLTLSPKLAGSLAGVNSYMKQYPYSCMEQKVSKAIALRDEKSWKKIMDQLPSYLDTDGLVKYFPSCAQGSDTLTAYILSISDEAGWQVPAQTKDRMTEALKGFIEGKIVRYSALPTADLSIRKLAALEALSRTGKAEPKLLDSITVEPNLWPTSAVLDWTNLLMRMKDIRNQKARLQEAGQIIRSRLNFQGTTMGFSTEGTDNLWWLMLSSDVNAVRSILTFLNDAAWQQDMPRIVRGALGRQHRGAWSLTTANAWGVLAMEKFSKKFESVPVTGETSVSLSEKTKTVAWEKQREVKSVMLGWPKEKETLKVAHKGKGTPWAVVQSLAAIPLKEAFSSGYGIKKTFTPVIRKTEGNWSRGDVVRVRLELEAQADMTWVVVNDPIPAGSAILGTGLGRDSQILAAGEERKGLVFPVFEERSFEAFRSYYEFVPKGKWTVEYTVRLNNPGTFHLPATRVEALYSPEMLGEIPNAKWEVAP